MGPRQRHAYGMFRAGDDKVSYHYLLAPIGYIPPAEVEANYYRSLREQVVPA